MHTHKPMTKTNCLPRAQYVLWRVFRNTNLDLTISQGGMQGNHSILHLTDEGIELNIKYNIQDHNICPLRSSDLWQLIQGSFHYPI